MHHLILKIAALILASLVTQKTFASSVTVTCRGPESATSMVVYLHGLDDPKPTQQELDNRTLLTKLATEQKFRLVIARSPFKCKTKVCWKHGTTDEHRLTYKLLKDAVNECKTKNVKDWGLLGFSNGGYFASKIVQYCIKDGPSWIIVSGSAGSWAHTYGGDKKSCPSLNVMIGDRDITRAKAKRYATYLASAGFSAQFTSFKGGHELREAPLKGALQQVLSP